MNNISLKENSTYQEKVNTAMSHMGAFFYPNSSLMRSLEEMRENLTTIVTSTWNNSSVLQTLNKTMYETMNDL